MTAKKEYRMPEVMRLVRGARVAAILLAVSFVILMILELVKARSSTVGETSLRMVNS